MSEPLRPEVEKKLRELARACTSVGQHLTQVADKVASGRQPWTADFRLDLESEIRRMMGTIIQDAWILPQ